MEIFAIVLLSMSVVTWGLPQYIEPAEIPGHLDDAYQFAYAVASPEHGDYHGHQQSRDENGFTSGSYYLLGADGQWSQTIFADKGLGYQALYNQRPAGAPPPQVSEVTYQVFVHPGATAISAQGDAGGAPAPPAPFGGIQQKSFVNQQVQNNQITQSQNRQPSRRFNRNTEVQDSANLQQLQSPQPSPRFNTINRDTQVLKSASLAVLPPAVAPEQRPRTNLREVTAPPAPFGGKQQKSLVSQQVQNNQITQSQNRQPSRRFNTNTEVQDSANLQQIQSPQPSPRFNTINRDTQVPKSTSQVVLPPAVAPEQRPRTNFRELTDIDTSASDNSNTVVFPVRRGMGNTRAMFGPATSIFNDDISSVMRRFG